MVFRVYRAFFCCEITGGSSAPSDETDGVASFALDARSPLSIERITARQIAHFLDHASHL